MLYSCIKRCSVKYNYFFLLFIVYYDVGYYKYFTSFLRVIFLQVLLLASHHQVYNRSTINREINEIILLEQMTSITNFYLKKSVLLCRIWMWSLSSEVEPVPIAEICNRFHMVSFYKIISIFMLFNRLEFGKNSIEIF